MAELVEIMGISHSPNFPGQIAEPNPEPAIVEGDAARLRQLVMILVDNAIRHSPTGGQVRVAVRQSGANASLEVEDQGRGVERDRHPADCDDGARHRRRGRGHHVAVHVHRHG